MTADYVPPDVWTWDKPRQATCLPGTTLPCLW